MKNDQNILFKKSFTFSKNIYFCLQQFNSFSKFYFFVKNIKKWCFSRLLFNLASSSSTVVEHFTHNPEVKGSKTPLAPGERKNGKITILNKLSTQISFSLPF
jgi:hypothetical protein